MKIRKKRKFKTFIIIIAMLSAFLHLDSFRVQITREEHIAVTHKQKDISEVKREKEKKPSNDLRVLNDDDYICCW